MCQGKLMQISRRIRPGQRLATGPEQNFARKEVTNYAKPEGWGMVGHNASEGIEPRNGHRCRRAKGFISWKPAAMHASGRVCKAGPGSESMAGHPTVCVGTWEGHAAPNGSLQQAEEARRGYGGRAVGPAHSRGVVGVMPGAGSGPTRRGWQ